MSWQRSLLCFVVGAAACGDDAGGTTQDAKLPDTGASVDAACTGIMSDHPEFWPTLCDVADTCGWLTTGHPELDYDEAGCLTRHASSADPATLLPYMAGFDARVHAAAACLGCQALLDAYFRPNLEDVFCGHLVRCGFLTDMAACRTAYEADAMRPGSQAKFDYACPRYCMEQLASDASCTAVMDCYGACQ